MNDDGYGQAGSPATGSITADLKNPLTKNSGVKKYLSATDFASSLNQKDERSVIFQL